MTMLTDILTSIIDDVFRTLTMAMLADTYILTGTDDDIFNALAVTMRTGIYSPAQLMMSSRPWP